jgi:hypothetical protein
VLWVAGIAGIFLFPAPAAAQQSACAPRDKMIGDLAQKYSESPTALGLSSDGSLVEVLTSDDGTTWTIIISMPNGMSCLVAAGESWTERKRDADIQARL